MYIYIYIYIYIYVYTKPNFKAIRTRKLLTIHLCSVFVLKYHRMELFVVQRTNSLVMVDKTGTGDVTVTRCCTRRYAGIIASRCWKFYWFQVLV